MGSLKGTKLLVLNSTTIHSAWFTVKNNPYSLYTEPCYSPSVHPSKSTCLAPFLSRWLFSDWLQPHKQKALAAHGKGSCTTSQREHNVSEMTILGISALSDRNQIDLINGNKQSRTECVEQSETLLIFNMTIHYWYSDRKKKKNSNESSLSFIVCDTSVINMVPRWSWLD